MGEKYLAYDPSGDASAWGLGRDEAYTESDIPVGPVNKAPVSKAGMGGSTPHPALSARPVAPVERHHTPEELMAIADAMEAKMGEEHKANLARGPVIRDEGTPPSWLNEYMEKQPFTDPYHSPPVAPDPEFRNSKFYMSEEERKRYADYYKKHKKK